LNRYLLDTNIVSEVRKPRPHGAVLAWIELQHDEQLFISAVTLGELQSGIERVRQHDTGKANEIESWLDQIVESYQVLPMDGRCFREWGRLMQEKPNQLLEDGMIAATARVHGLVVATRNERDFREFDVRIINPFKAS
jgi:predicted nucleic acid-binding protein